MKTKESVAKPVENDKEFVFDEESVIWLNLTRSGKGVKIVTADDRMYISSIANIANLVSKKYSGVKFTELLEVVS